MSRTFASYLRASRHARPARVDAGKNAAVLNRFPIEKLEIFLPLAATDFRSESLAFVHAPAGGGDLRIRLAEEWLIAASFELDQTSRIKFLVASALESFATNSRTAASAATASRI